MVYDTFLTFGDEVIFIWWQQRKAAAFWLYFLARYGTIAAETTFLAYEVILPQSPIRVT